MSRIHTCLTTVMAALFWLSSDLSFGAGIACQRIDTSEQLLMRVSASSFAQSSIAPSNGSGNTQRPGIGSATVAEIDFSEAGRSGGSNSQMVATLIATNPNPWGSTNISQPQVSLSMGASMSADVDPTDPMALAESMFSFGDSDAHACEAIGQYVANSGNQNNGTFNGVIDIIISIGTQSGDAGLSLGDAVWVIKCGDSSLTGELNASGDGWDVTGTLIVNNEAQPISESWPLDVNTVLATSKSVPKGYAFPLQIDVYNFEVNATADPEVPHSAFVGGMSFTSSASIQ